MVGKRFCSRYYHLLVGDQTFDTIDILGIVRMSGDLTASEHGGRRDFQSVVRCMK